MFKFSLNINVIVEKINDRGGKRNGNSKEREFILARHYNGNHNPHSSIMVIIIFKAITIQPKEKHHQ